MFEQLSLPGCAASTCSAAAPPASPSAAPASSSERAILDGSGPSTSASSADSATCPPSSSRTSPRASVSGCPVCSTISCPWVTGSKPGALELWMWGLRTEGCEPSCWASPVRRDGDGGTSGPNRRTLQLRDEVRLWASPMAADGRGRAGPGRESSERQLSNQIVPWATPTRHGNTNRKGASPTSGDGLRTQVMWPTPVASTGGYNQEGEGGRLGQSKRPSLRALNGGEGRLLSARWVECLMGFPVDWTAIDGPPVGGKRSTKTSPRAQPKGAKSPTTQPASVPSGTPSSRRSRRS